MKVTKRNGNVVVYDDEKVARSILKANAASGEPGLPERVAKGIAGEAFNNLIEEKGVIATSDVREYVHSFLVKRGYPKTAKAYLEYKKV